MLFIKYPVLMFSEFCAFSSLTLVFFCQKWTLFFILLFVVRVAILCIFCVYIIQIGHLGSGDVSLGMTLNLRKPFSNLPSFLLKMLLLQLFQNRNIPLS